MNPNFILKDLLDVKELNSLMYSFFELTQIPIGIINTEGDVLAGSGWHNSGCQLNLNSSKSCYNCGYRKVHQSNETINGELLYKCKCGLYDLITPIVIKRITVGYLMMGQFFFEDEPYSLDFFELPAAKIPTIQKSKLETAKVFFFKLAEFLSHLSYKNIQLFKWSEKEERLTKSLHDSEKYKKAILDATTESILILDLEGKITSINKTAASRINLPPERILNHYVSEFFSENVLSFRANYMEKLLESGNPVHFEDERDGILFSHHFFPVYDEDKITRIVSYSQDVTSRKKIEKEIGRLASFPMLNPEPIIELDADGEIIFSNKAVLKTLNDLKIPNNIEAFLPEDIDDIISLSKNGAVNNLLRREVRINHRIFDERIYFTEYPKAIRIYISDITESRRLVDQLNQLKSAVEHSPNSIIITDKEGNIEYANPKFSEISGYTHEEILGKNPRIQKSGNTKPAVYKKLWKTILNGKEWRGSFQNRKKSGELYWESVNIAPVFNAQGNITHFTAVKSDITQQIEHQNQLKRLIRNQNAMRKSKNSIIQAKNERNFLKEICEILLKDCNYEYISLDFKTDENIKSITFLKIRNKYHKELDCDLNRMKGSIAIKKQVIDSGKSIVCNNIKKSPFFKFLRKQAEICGIGSIAVIPIQKEASQLGAISVYSKNFDVFSAEEIKLLDEISKDISYGISVISLRKAHEIAEKKLKKQYDILEEQVLERTMELENTNQVFKEAQKVAHIGHWRLDLINNHLIWSDEVFNIFGNSPKNFNATLEDFLNFVHPDDREFVKNTYLKSVKSKKPYDIEHRIITPNKKVKIVLEKGRTYFSENNEPLYSIGIVQDVTEIKKVQEERDKHKLHLEELIKERTAQLISVNRQLQEEIEKERQVELLLEESLEKEKELNELKSRFISTTSHEFRTPLTSILSSVQLIQRYKDKWDEEKLNELFSIVKKSTMYLTNLLDDILTVNYADKGKIIFNPDQIDLYQLCSDLIKENSYSEKEHGFNFKYKSHDREFLLDKKLIRFMITNLLSNAFKYSPEGGEIELVITSNTKHIKITVSDSGIGIPSEEIDQLFNPFFRASNTNKIEGTGLGLSIVKRAVELHSGNITVKSQEKGTKFIIIIPRRTR